MMPDRPTQPMMCDKCGKLHNPAKCQGHSKGHNGGQCGRDPMAGQKVCYSHGGAAKQNRAAGAVRVAEEKVSRKLGKLVIVPVDNPLEELRMLAGEAAAWKRLCAEHVAELERLRYSTDGGEQIRGEIQLFERALDRCNAILLGIAKLNLDERIVRVSEAHVSAILNTFRAGMRDAKVGPEQERQVILAVAGYLRPSPN